jgi:hypothetical protein
VQPQFPALGWAHHFGYAEMVELLEPITSHSDPV